MRPKADSCRQGHDLNNPANVMQFTAKGKTQRRCRICQYAGQHRYHRKKYPLSKDRYEKELADPTIAYFRESIDRAEVHQRRREEKQVNADIDRELHRLYPGKKEYPGILEAPFMHRLLNGCLDIDPDLKQQQLRKAITDSFGKMPCGRLFPYNDDGKFSNFKTIDHIQACSICGPYFKPQPTGPTSNVDFGQPETSNVDFGKPEPSNVDFGAIEPAKSQPSNVDFS